MSPQVRKHLKRFLGVIAVLLGIVVVACAVGLVLLRRTPQWYQMPAMTAEEREAAAQRATNKLAIVQNEAARIRAEERAGKSSATQRFTAAPITISFTDQELNAFFDKWATWNNWKRAYEKHLTDPVVILKDGRLILAARMKELGAVASLHFRPHLDEKGQLHLEFDRVLGGQLPLPEAIFSDSRRRLVQSMRWRIPAWRRAAALDRSGAPNPSAVAAAMGTLLIQILDQKPGEPLLFLPLVDKGFVAVRLVDVKIEDHSMTFTVQPLSSAEREAMLLAIKQN